ncbi:DUF3886 domain-containing protein [Paenibacillus harenae]|uniref:DUF3886 domain-containing protein n=1 Tax=Paenibacillus harenae TaxID=306543 RepID=A0ABT9TV92_PAEHA|nr:DUF3886 domain-containing protein [Paenibacillus harenae]MDQ0061344.1 hypothetical protein [Paenibacillus harenae]MDQ0110786.1 hypothetical protein [Paenibacillus harenae]
MAKNKKKQAAPFKSMQTKEEKDNQLLLGDLLNADTLRKLKGQADELKQQEAAKKLQARQAEEERKAQEQKRKESDFAYLLENSDPNWRKHK